MSMYRTGPVSLELSTIRLLVTLATCLSLATACWAEMPRDRQADLLIVGGTESGWAAAIQAARQGVERIVLVNDIEWLGGQFTAEALVAIDENRSEEETKRTNVRRRSSIPRSGLFKELTDRIEAFNQTKYGHPQPGNTTVRTTCRPAEAEAVFRAMLKPYVESGQVEVVSNCYPFAAELADDGTTLRRVRFRSTDVLDARDSHESDFAVTAKITIDASDWGEVIQLSGAEFDYGPDLREDYGEPLAPIARDGFPLTDMNPITYCMVIEETDSEDVVPRPAHYDERRYFNTTRLTKSEHDALPWPRKPVPAFAPVDTVYASRRIVDRYGLTDKPGPDAILLCWFVQDYPLDILPRHVVEQLERVAPHASEKNLVTMSRRERKIVFEDAKRHSLGMLHHLQTTVHERMTDRTHSFRRFRLSHEFGTPDRLPPKPYVRESLRLDAMYVMRQQDTTPTGPGSETYGRVMYHDGVVAWQFEYDFHMTGRTFLPGEEGGQAWQSYFKPGRSWGPPYAGLCVFPLRSLIPERVDGLLGAQKNLGYSSIVSSAFRLHDQCIAIGQAAGAAAALSLEHNLQPRAIPFDRSRLADVRQALCSSIDGGLPVAVWPFRDLEVGDPAYMAANLLAASGAMPCKGNEVDFRPDEPATAEWRHSIVEATRAIKPASGDLDVAEPEMTRGEFAAAWWEAIRELPDAAYVRQSETDADADGVPDVDDALPLEAAK